MGRSAEVTTISAPFEKPHEVTVAVVEAVAESRGVSPLELPPLADIIDPDALERLVGSNQHDGAMPCQVIFEYAEREVTVTDGEVVVISLKATDSTS